MSTPFRLIFISISYVLRGKNEMIQYMFDRRADKWFMKDTKEEVTILRQKYFAKAKDGKKYTA